MTTITALVPMRHHSERVPEKNFRLVGGKPLYVYIIETLMQCTGISKIVVDTDSPTIKDGLMRTYPSVTVIDRPNDLRDGMISMNEVLYYDVSQIESAFYLQTHSTNPLLRSETIDGAIQTFSELYPNVDSLFSVTRIQTRLWDEDGTPINHQPASLLRTQDLPPIYEENSCMYLFEREGFLKRRNRLGERPFLYEISAIEALDIDEETDVQIAECLLQLLDANEE